MKGVVASSLITIAWSSSAIAQQHGHQLSHDPLAAPIPLLGAGLPGFAVALGLGVYWLARRHQNLG